jgi:SAM-dependent methyltransferase
VFFLQDGYDVRGIDPDPEAVAATRAVAARLAPHRPADSFQVASLERHMQPDASADVVIVSAVLHFAADHQHFDAMLAGAWRVLAPGGLFFARLASSIGIEDAIQPIATGRYRLPDGSDRYLVDEARLMAATARLGGRLLDPLKTTVVQGQRAMTTWVLQKP